MLLSLEIREAVTRYKGQLYYFLFIFGAKRSKTVSNSNSNKKKYFMPLN